MNFKKASLLFTTAFSLSAGAVTDALSRPAAAEDIAKSRNTCYSVGKYALTEENILNFDPSGPEAFADIYQQPWYGRLPNPTAQPRLLSESRPGYNFVVF